MISPIHWLLLSAGLFSIALLGLLTRRNLIGLLLSLEIALNSVALNFVVVNRFYSAGQLDGQIMAIFVIAVAAAEAVAAIGIFLLFFRRRQTVDVRAAEFMKG